MEKDNSLFKYNGKTYKLVKKPDSFGCTEICPLALANEGNCEELCSEALLDIEAPEFSYTNCMFVEVTENKETTMEEKEHKNEPDYKALYEEEHKKNQAAIATAKILRDNSSNEICKKKIEAIFPELKESEDDRIRKRIKNALIEWGEKCSFPGDVDDMLQWLENQGKNDMGISEATKQKLENSLNKALEKETPESWNESLEKQGEQKPTDKVEPKFKVGDWIISSEGTLRHIVAVDKTGYETDKGWLTHDDYERSFHLWTIQDAKDGDVLSTRLSPEGDWVGIYKQSIGPNGFNTYCFLNSIGEFVINPNRCKNHGTHGLHPATKEQRDLLFTKMKEEGYEWDAEKKELKKIEQKSAAYFYCKCVGTTPKCGDCVRNHLNSKYKIEDIKTWMTPTSRSTKQCSDYIPKDSVKWSDGDQCMLDNIINDEMCTLDIETINWLKSLKGRLSSTNKNDFDKGYEVGMSAAKFNQWKPTEEQMNAFADLLGVYFGEPQTYKTVESLYNDLKKL